MRVSICRFRLSQRPATHQAPDLRRFLGAAFADEIQQCCHDADGQPLFEYPRIQWKVVESTAVLLGIAEGAEWLQRLWPQLQGNELGDGRIQVVDMDYETSEEELAVNSDPIEYRFLTPWLGLNQKNFRSYVGSRNQGFRKDELSRILVGNCLGLLKSLDIRFHGRIDANGRSLTSIKTMLNGSGAIGFVGKFEVNLTLPDYLGLGRSVTHGFGAICRA